MAELVLGVASSHSPMVTMDGEHWLEWGLRDHQHPMLYTREGRNVSYEEQLALVGGAMEAHATLEKCRVGAGRVDAAVTHLQTAIEEADLDVIIVIGDDQDEHLLAHNLPAFLVYWGDTIPNSGIDNFDELPSLTQRFLPGWRERDGERSYNVDSQLARHIIEQAFSNDFDVASSNELPQVDEGMGHAFGFPLRRLIMGDTKIVPVLVNTYNPPSQPRASRCVAFGEMLRDSIASFPGDARVGVIASGGLSHFLVLEDLDREVIAAFERQDFDALTAIPETTYVSGTSEIKNWIVAGSTCRDLSFELVDYVPGYRTPAATGTGLGFGLWH